MMRPTRILIVDDDTSYRRLLHIALSTTSGLEVIGEAADGSAAIDQARRLQPDLVLMDYHMPVMNGLDAARLLLHAPDCPAVVLLTSDTSPELCAAARLAGVRAVLAKGISINELGRVVLNAAGRQAALERAA